ncbi:MAG: hypothetical protein GY870_03460, partial [archaeon]|nr:hypothetical protein [archaeon]
WLCYDDKHAKSPHVQRFSPIPINLSGKGIPYDFVDKLVKNGEVIAIMPEGHCATIGEGYRLWKFYPGVIKLHLRYKIPIIPTANIGFVKATPKISTVYNPNKVPCWENSKYAPFVLPKKLIIHFGKPVSFEEYYDKAVDKETLSHLSMLLRRKVKETIAIYREGVTWNNPYGKKTNNYKRNKK